MNPQELADYIGTSLSSATHYLFGSPPKIQSTIRLNPETNRGERVITITAAKKYLAGKKKSGRKPANKSTKPKKVSVIKPRKT